MKKTVLYWIVATTLPIVDHLGLFTGELSLPLKKHESYNSFDSNTEKHPGKIESNTCRPFEVARNPLKFKEGNAHNAIQAHIFVHSHIRILVEKGKYYPTVNSILAADYCGLDLSIKLSKVCFFDKLVTKQTTHI